MAKVNIEVIFQNFLGDVRESYGRGPNRVFKIFIILCDRTQCVHQFCNTSFQEKIGSSR